MNAMTTKWLEGKLLILVKAEFAHREQCLYFICMFLINKSSSFLRYFIFTLLKIARTLDLWRLLHYHIGIIVESWIEIRGPTPHVFIKSLLSLEQQYYCLHNDCTCVTATRKADDDTAPRISLVVVRFLLYNLGFQ